MNKLQNQDQDNRKDLDNLEDDDILNMSMEDIDKVLNAAESDVSTPDDDDSDKDIEVTEDPKAKETQSDEVITKKEDSPSEPDKADNSKEGELSKPALVLIDEDFIKNAESKDQKILQKLKGETVSTKMLNMYLNQERLLGKKMIRPEDLGMKPDDESSYVKPPQPQQTNIQSDKGLLPSKETDQANVIKSNYLKNRMLAKYKDYPKDPEEEADLAYSNPRRWNEILRAETLEKEKIDQMYDEAVNVQRNYPTINRTVIQDDVTEIKNEAANLGIDLKELGFDFTIDENGANDIIDQLLTDQYGNFDKNVVTARFGVPEVQKGALANKFFNQYRKNILNIVRATTARNATLNKNKKTFEPSLDSIKSAGHLDSSISAKDIENITDPEKLKELENDLFK